MTNQPESAKVLQECIDLQLRKSRDYQNPNSTVKQADYYPNGVITIYDIMHAKMLRMKSVMEAMRNDGYDPNFESLEDSAKDLINYASFFVSYCRNKIPGQDADRDAFNKKIETKEYTNKKAASLIEDDGMITVSTLTNYDTISPSITV
jgi:hypothetical protein